MSWINAETVSIILFFIGMMGMIVRTNMMISVISIGIMDSAIILFFITLNSAINIEGANYAYHVVDPVPHALMITSIVIGVAIKAISLIMILDLYHDYNTLDWNEAKHIRENVKNAIKEMIN